MQGTAASPLILFVTLATRWELMSVTSFPQTPHLPQKIYGIFIRLMAQLPATATHGHGTTLSLSLTSGNFGSRHCHFKKLCRSVLRNRRSGIRDNSKGGNIITCSTFNTGQPITTYGSSTVIGRQHHSLLSSSPISSP
jgi:hypothetical protein